MERAETDTRDGLGPRLLALVRQAPGLTALVVMAIIGIAISAYLTIDHYTKGPLACPFGGGLIDCARVTTSPYSVVPGTQLPITVPGFVWFVVSGGLAVLALTRLAQNTPEPARLRLAQFIWSAAGLAFVLYLVYAEIVLLHNICAWCTIVHLLTFATFLVTLGRLTQPAEVGRPALTRHGGTRIIPGASAPRPTYGHQQGRASTQRTMPVPARTQKARSTPSRSRRHR